MRKVIVPAALMGAVGLAARGDVRHRGDVVRWWTPLWGEMARVSTEMVTIEVG